MNYGFMSIMYQKQGNISKMETTNVLKILKMNQMTTISFISQINLCSLWNKEFFNDQSFCHFGMYLIS